MSTRRRSSAAYKFVKTSEEKNGLNLQHGFKEMAGREIRVPQSVGHQPN